MGTKKADGSLMEVIEETAGKKGIFWWDNERNIFAESNSDANNATTLLAYLPDLYKEHLELQDQVAALLAVVAAQQQQIAQLSENIDAAVNAQVGMVLADRMYKLVQENVDKGATVEDCRVEAEFAAEVKRSSTTATGKESEHRRLEVSAEENKKQVNIIALGLGGLGLGTESKQSKQALKEAKERMSSFDASSFERKVSGTVSVKVGKLTPGVSPRGGHAK